MIAIAELIVLSQDILVVPCRICVQRILTISADVFLVLLSCLAVVAAKRNQYKRYARKCQVLCIHRCWVAPERKQYQPFFKQIHTVAFLFIEQPEASRLAILQLLF